MDDILFGRNPVLEALKGNRSINKIFLLEGAKEGSIREIYSLARERKIIVNYTDKKGLDKIVERGNHQGVVAYVAPKNYVEWEEILEKAKEKNQQPFLVILDELEDPHNLGAIIRTVDAVGAHGVIIPKRRAVPLTMGVAKSSAGALEYVPVARVNNINNVIDELKEQGCWVLGADMAGEGYYFEKDLTGPIALVIGSEGKGLSRLTKEKCDLLVKIPMMGSVNSLNASVAASVLLYEIRRQRIK